MSGSDRIPDGFVVKGDKVTEYLLNPEHPRGRSKARFFLAFGFSRESSTTFADAPLFHPLDNEASAQILEDGDRRKLVCEGPLRTPDGRSPKIRTVWLIDEEGTASFVTAVPLTRARQRSQ